MSEEKEKPGGDVRPDAGRHEEFLELCALATSGSLSDQERTRLQEHLAICADCRAAMKEFEIVAGTGVSALASNLAPGLTGMAVNEDPSFSSDAAEASFFRRLSEEKKRFAEPMGDMDGWLSPLVVRRSRNFRRNFERFHLWVPLAAAALLCVSLGILTYRMGKHRGVEVAQSGQGSVEVGAGGSVEALETAMRERDEAKARLSEQDKVIAALRREMARQSGEIKNLNSLQANQDLALKGVFEEKKQWSAEREGKAQQVKSLEAALEISQNNLHALEAHRSEETIHAASLEAQVAELSRAVGEQRRNVEQDHDLLAKDRDIRELMGARDLYITEVYDVSKTGATEKAFGRVFYTKGKSLIFYAYDLKDGPSVKEASTFQAWGCQGADWKQGFSLGMLYEDNAAKKRWTLKFNDKKALERIDAVFVTVEPNGGSERPTGKPVLFAYLKVNANHP